MPTPGSAPPSVPLRSEHERQSYRQPAIWHRHRPLTRCHGPDRRRHARCWSPPGRPAARIARYAHDASSCRPVPPSGRVNRRTGHAPHPLADGRIHAWRHLGRTGSAPAVEPGGRCRRYGVPTGPRWAACGRYFVRVTKVRGASDGRFTPSVRHDTTGACLDHRPTHVSPVLFTPARLPSKSGYTMWRAATRGGR